MSELILETFQVEIAIQRHILVILLHGAFYFNILFKIL